MKNERLNFDSYGEFLDFVENTPIDPAWGVSPTSQGKRSEDNPWSGTNTFQEAIDLARDGWMEGRELLSTIHAEMTGSTSVEVIEVEQRVQDIVGDEVDMPAYIAGDPECMISTETANINSRFVRIVIAADTNGGISPETIINRGGAILSYIDALEAAGWRCEVVYYVEARANKQRFSVETVIKKASEPVDIDRLSFAIANPAMLRRFFFKCLETRKWTVKNFRRGGYGAPACERPIDADLYFPFQGGCNTQEAAISYAEAIVDNDLKRTA